MSIEKNSICEVERQLLLLRINDERTVIDISIRSDRYFAYIENSKLTARDVSTKSRAYLRKIETNYIYLLCSYVDQFGHTNSANSRYNLELQTNILSNIVSLKHSYLCFFSVQFHHILFLQKFFYSIIPDCCFSYYLFHESSFHF